MTRTNSNASTATDKPRSALEAAEAVRLAARAVAAQSPENPTYSAEDILILALIAERRDLCGHVGFVKNSLLAG